MPSTFYFSNSPPVITSTQTDISQATYNNRYLQLTGVTLGNDVTGLANYAFWACTGLYTCTIPNSVLRIGSNAFSQCSNLTGVNFEPISSVNFMGDTVFYYSRKFKSVSIPDSVKTIGGQFFGDCVELTGVTFGSGLSGIAGGDPNSSFGSSMFDNCSGLSGISVNPLNTVFSSESDVLFNKNKTNLIICAKAKTGFYNIPSSVTGIATSAFEMCYNITGVSIPSAVRIIGGPFANQTNVFRNCASLTGISVDPLNTRFSSASGVLFNQNKTTLITYPQAKTGPYNIPSSVNNIQNSAFYYSRLDAVSIPSAVANMGFSVFQYSNLTGVTFVPTSSLTSLVSSTFWDCRRLEKITLPDSITNIGTWAFYGCTGLASVNIPPNTQRIEYAAFQSCASLTSITLPKTLQTIEEQAFTSCSGLTSVSLPEGLTTVGPRILSSCTNLNTVYIPKSLKNLNSQTFTNCANLMRVICLGDAPIVVGTNTFTNANANLKVYRKKNFVIGWGSTFVGRPVALISDNVIKSGGTGKLTTKPRAWAYISPSINGLSFFANFSTQLSTPPPYVNREDFVMQLGPGFGTSVYGLRDDNTRFFGGPITSTITNFTENSAIMTNFNPSAVPFKAITPFYTNLYLQPNKTAIRTVNNDAFPANTYLKRFYIWTDNGLRFGPYLLDVQINNWFMGFTYDSAYFDWITTSLTVQDIDQGIRLVLV